MKVHFTLALLLIASASASAGSDFSKYCTALKGEQKIDATITKVSAVTDAIVIGNRVEPGLVAIAKVEPKDAPSYHYGIRRGSTVLYDLTKTAYLTGVTVNVCVAEDENLNTDLLLMINLNADNLR
ncbi:hypothetical protein [Vibrio jasicida]|uniref:hypothetical protein n=1 Tax=Vibrio jasicida TaxID=766224 RepID=UPI000CE4F746|nr:hypothetical protein [Vibrio jasicida]